MPALRQIYIDKFRFERLDNGLLSMLLALKNAYAVEEVELIYQDKWGKITVFDSDGLKLFYSGTMSPQIQYIEGAVMLSDDRVISCITSNDGGDTNHPGQNETYYYIGTLIDYV